MTYTFSKAESLTETLRRFTTGYDHHVVGQCANLDFWNNEILSAQKLIDGYEKMAKGPANGASSSS